MSIFGNKPKVIFQKGVMKVLYKVAPQMDLEKDEYRTIIRLAYEDELGHTQNLELKLGIRELHQLTLNLYYACQKFNIPIDNPTAERARQFWGMQP